MNKNKITLTAIASLFIALVYCGLSMAFPANSTAPASHWGNTEVIEAYSYNNITTDTDTQVKSSPGVIAGVLVNGGTMGQITVYDNTSCSTTTVATIASPYAGQVIPLGIYASTGICVTTADNTNITVIYK